VLQISSFAFWQKMEDKKFRIRAALFYDFKQGKSPAESHRTIITVFGEESIHIRQCQRWFQRFQGGDESLVDEPHQGHTKDDDLLALIEDCPTLTVRELAEIFEVSHMTIKNYLHKLGKRIELENGLLTS
jgi:hypothetical protein